MRTTRHTQTRLSGLMAALMMLLTLAAGIVGVHSACQMLGVATWWDGYVSGVLAAAVLSRLTSLFTKKPRTGPYSRSWEQYDRSMGRGRINGVLPCWLLTLCCLLTVLFGPLAGAARAQWTPASVPGLSCWYEPDRANSVYKDLGKTQPCTTAGDAIAVLADLSGNGYDATQPTSGQRLAYYPNNSQFGGVPFAYGAGVTSAIVPAGAIGNPNATGYTEVIVYKYDVTSNATSMLTSQAYQQSDLSVSLQPGVLHSGGISDGGSGASTTDSAAVSGAPACLVRRFIPYNNVDVAMGRTTWWVNGRVVYDSYALACDNASNVGQMYLGDLSIALGQGYGIIGPIGMYAYYHRPCTDDEAAGLSSYACSRFNLAYTATQPKVTPTRAINIIGSGNSIMAGYTTSGQTALNQLQDLLPYRCNVFNFGKGFATTSYIAGAAAGKELRFVQPGALNVVIFLEGTNALQADSYNATTAYNEMVSYATAVRATGAKFLVCTVLPVTGNTTFNTAATALNADLLADTTHFDGVINLAGDSANIPTSDGTHPNNAGQARIARYDFLPAVLAITNTTDQAQGLAGVGLTPSTPAASAAQVAANTTTLGTISTSASTAATQATAANTATGTILSNQASSTPAAFITALHADAQWKEVHAYTAGNTNYNPATHHEDVYDVIGGIVGGSPQLGFSLTVVSGVTTQRTRS